MNRWQRKRLKENKRADRKKRSLKRKTNNLKKRLGLDKWAFFSSWNNSVSFSLKTNKKPYYDVEIDTPDDFRALVLDNKCELRNLDTGRTYASFEEWKMELLIIKLAGIK